MIQFKGLIYQNSQNAPEAPINTLLINDFYESVFGRIDEGRYTFKSPSFKEQTKVFLPFLLTDNARPLVTLFDGNEVRGYVAVGYAYEDREGVVYIYAYDIEMVLSDNVLVNFPLTIEAVQQI